MGKLRLHHFDILKGIAIFMVVMGHVLTMCIRDIDSAVLFKVLEKTHMPIFFFISGYFTYKILDSGKLAMPNFIVRAKQLLIPFFVVSTLWIYYFPHSGLQSPFDSTWQGLYMSVGKNGYWFTLCLFEVILLYAAIVPVLSRCRRFGTSLLVVVAVWIILGCLSNIWLPQNVVNLLGMPLVYEFFPIFMFGVLARSRQEQFDKVTGSSAWVTIAMIAGGFLMYYVCWPWKFPFPTVFWDISKSLLYLCVVIVAIAVIRPWCVRAFGEGSTGNGSRWARIWKYLGENSLAVYLLHYFFLFPMSAFREPLIAMNLDFVPTFIVSAFFAAIIITITLGVNYVICHSRLLALLLTGKVK